MPSPNQNSADMKAWLAKANSAQWDFGSEFGNPSDESDQGNPTDKAITGAGRDVSSDGSLDSNS